MSKRYDWGYDDQMGMWAKIFWGSLLGVFVLMIILTFTGIPEICSEGERTGTLTKISHKGYFVKTWEGELAMGAVENNVPVLWGFTVKDEKLVKKIRESSGQITLVYREYWRHALFDMESDYLIIEIKQKVGEK